MAGLNTLQRAFNTALRFHLEACARAEMAEELEPTDARRGAVLWAHNRRRRVSARRNRDGARKARQFRRAV